MLEQDNVLNQSFKRKTLFHKVLQMNNPSDVDLQVTGTQWFSKPTRLLYIFLSDYYALTHKPCSRYAFCLLATSSSRYHAIVGCASSMILSYVGPIRTEGSSKDGGRY